MSRSENAESSTPDAPLALVTATQAEMRHALAGLATDDAGGLPAIPGRGTVLSRLAGREALLVVTGVGPVNAAMEMGAALERHAMSGAVNLGVAGSFNLDRAPLASAVAADAEIYADFGVAGPDGVPSAEGFPFPLWEGDGERVFERIGLQPDRAALAMGLCLPEGLIRGTGLTAAGITSGPERARALAGRHAALTESMEGFALALACRTRNVPFLEIRTVSNGVGERDHARWRLKQALAGLGAVLAGLWSGPGL